MHKAIKIAPKSVWTFIIRENKLCMNLWWQRNKSDILHNKGCYHKGQYKVMFLCIKSLHIQKLKAHDNLCFPLRRAYLLLLCIYFYVFTFYARVNSVLLYFLFIFLFCKHHVVGKDLGTYIQLDMSDHELLLLTSPLRWISWEAKSQAPIFLCVWLKLLLHIYVVSVSNHRR